MPAKVLCLDIETQRAITETFTLYKPFIHIDRVIVPTRVLCFAAKWRDEDKVIFKSCWDDPVTVGGTNPEAEAAYLKMMQAAYDLCDEADIVVTYNGDRFDLDWFNWECGRLKLGRPGPYKSIDLIKTNKTWFKGAQLSLKLDWSCRQWLKDRKVPHGGTDLWHDIRWGTRDEKRAACKLMRQYNEYDTVLTGRLFEDYLPWLTVNLALYDTVAGEDDLLHCTKCNSTNVHRRGSKYFVTLAGTYNLWRCADCNCTSKGSRRRTTTELRPV